MDTIEQAPRLRLWRIRAYVLWLVSDTSNGLAYTLVSFAIPLLALMTTGDPAAAGTVAAVGAVTRALSAIVGGIVADRLSRTRLMVIGGLLGTAVSAAFTFLAFTGGLGFASLVIIEFALSVRAGLFGIAGEAALKDVVPAAAMGRAQSANQARDAALSLAGSPLGGLLLGVGAWLLGLVMLTAKVVGTLFAWLLGRAAPEAAERPARMPSEGETRRGAAWHEFRQGVAWVWGRRDLRGVIALACVINLGLGIMSSTVIYAMQQDGVPVEIIGLVSGIIGVGMLLGAALAPLIVTRIRAGIVLLIGVVMTSAVPLLLTFITAPPAIAGVLSVGVLLLPAVNAGLSGYLLVATPRELMGRVSSVMQLAFLGLTPLAPLVAGFGLAQLGRAQTLWLSFAICSLAVLIGTFSTRVRQIPAEEGWQRYAEENGTPPARPEATAEEAVSESA